MQMGKSCFECCGIWVTASKSQNAFVCFVHRSVGFGRCPWVRLGSREGKFKNVVQFPVGKNAASPSLLSTSAGLTICVIICGLIWGTIWGIIWDIRSGRRSGIILGIIFDEILSMILDPMFGIIFINIFGIIFGRGVPNLHNMDKCGFVAVKLNLFYRCSLTYFVF